MNDYLDKYIYFVVGEKLNPMGYIKLYMALSGYKFQSKRNCVLALSRTGYFEK